MLIQGIPKKNDTNFKISITLKLIKINSLRKQLY